VQRLRVDLKDFAQGVDAQRSRLDAVVFGQNCFGNDMRAPVQLQEPIGGLKASQHSALLYRCGGLAVPRPLTNIQTPIRCDALQAQTVKCRHIRRQSSLSEATRNERIVR